jgi:hypothetical protein
VVICADGDGQKQNGEYVDLHNAGVNEWVDGSKIVCWRRTPASPFLRDL